MKKNLNIYDTKVIRCTKCQLCIGEVESDAQIIRPLCAKCADPMPDKNKILYTISAAKNILNPKKVLLYH